MSIRKTIKIWVDGDACPNEIKAILFRAAIRTKIHVEIVANHNVSIPPSPFIKKRQVPPGCDAADQYILTHMQHNDLVITADIPFAHTAVIQGGLALNPRGELYSHDNIKQHLTLRNLKEELRSTQVFMGGPAKLSAKEIRLFAANLDQFLSKQMPKHSPYTDKS